MEIGFLTPCDRTTFASIFGWVVCFYWRTASYFEVCVACCVSGGAALAVFGLVPYGAEVVGPKAYRHDVACRRSGQLLAIIAATVSAKYSGCMWFLCC